MTTTATPSPTEATDQTQSTPVQPAQPVAAPTQTLSILALVFGVVSFFGIGWPAAIAAIVLGAIAWNREPRGHTMALIGMIAAGLNLVGGFVFAIVGLAFALPFLGALPFLPFW